jgi:hypothetical protein
MKHCKSICNVMWPQMQSLKKEWPHGSRCAMNSSGSMSHVHTAVKDVLGYQPQVLHALQAEGSHCQHDLVCKPENCE